MAAYSARHLPQTTPLLPLPPPGAAYLAAGHKLLAVCLETTPPPAQTVTTITQQRQLQTARLLQHPLEVVYLEGLERTIRLLGPRLQLLNLPLVALVNPLHQPQLLLLVQEQAYLEALLPAQAQVVACSVLNLQKALEHLAQRQQREDLQGLVQNLPAPRLRLQQVDFLVQNLQNLLLPLLLLLRPHPVVASFHSVLNPPPLQRLLPLRFSALLLPRMLLHQLPHLAHHLLHLEVDFLAAGVFWCQARSSCYRGS